MTRERYDKRLECVAHREPLRGVAAPFQNWENNMTAEIIELRKKAEEKDGMIWRCGCGDCAFIIYDNGAIECVDCNAFQRHETLTPIARRWSVKVTK